MNKIKAIGAMALFAAMLTGISGLAVAGSNIPITGSLTLPATSTSVTCPAFAQGQFTICTAVVTGNNPTGSVAFSTNDPTGQFTPTSCTLNGIGGCNVIYSDTVSGGPIITAAYSGDGLNGVSSENTVATVNIATCGLETSKSSLSLSEANIDSIIVTNVGNTNTLVTVSGSNWIGSTISLGSFSVSQTLWGLISPPSTPLANTIGVVTAIPLLTNSTPQSIFFSAKAPAGTKSGTYTQSITLASSC